jgi:putative RNA 2'-phosphotransferase
MLRGHDNVKLSKAVSQALRHAPEEYGLSLDEEGWVPYRT